MKFVVDEDLPKALTKLLREKGHEVFDIRELGFRGISDDEVFNLAQTKQAALFTADLGFSNLIKFPQGTHFGIVITRFPNEISTKNMVELISQMLNELSEKDICGSLIILSPHRIRLRNKN